MVTSHAIKPYPLPSVSKPVALGRPGGGKSADARPGGLGGESHYCLCASSGRQGSFGRQDNGHWIDGA